MSDDINPPDLSHPVAQLSGTRWRLSEIRDATGVRAISDGVEASLRLEDDHAEVEAGCNRGRASVTLEPDALDFGPLALTRMACGPEAMDVEAAVTGVLGGRVPYELQGRVLVLTGAASTLVYRADLA